MQATMSLIEGHGNLVMNLVGSAILPSFGRLDAAYRRRGGERGPLERLLWRVTGLDMKLQQYRVGEQFTRSVHDRYGMDVLNRVWDGPDALPRLDELGAPDRWYRRVVRGVS
jgi:putative hydrolase